MCLSVLSLSKKQDFQLWYKYFLTTNDLNIFSHPEYLYAFSNIKNEGESYCAVFRKDDFILLFPFIKKKISNINIFKFLNKEYYDIFSPYGYGGFFANRIPEKNFIVDFQISFRKFCKRNNIIAEFIRFNLFKEVEISCYLGEVQKINENIFVNLKKSEEEIWKNYEHKVRKNVKRAQKHGLEFFSSLNKDHIDEFYSIYIKTLERNEAKKEYFFSKKFFQHFAEKLNKFCKFFYVSFEEKIISAELILYSRNFMYSFLGGTLSDFYQFRPNDFLKHQLIIWGRKNNFSAFVLGGGYQPEDGIFRYKKSFNPSGIIPFYVGKKIYNKNVYNKLCRLIIKKTKINKKEFYNRDYFPLYRS